MTTTLKRTKTMDSGLLVASVLFTFLSLPLVAADVSGTPAFTLELEPAETVPGIPVNLILGVRNGTSQSLRIPEAIALRVSPSAGNPFLADGGGFPPVTISLPDVYKHNSVIPPGESKRYVFAVSSLESSPDWFVDRRLSFPGAYRLQMLLGFEPPHDPHSRWKSQWESTEAVLTVTDPTGEDKLIWEEMLNRTGGRGWGALNWIHETGRPLANNLIMKIWNERPDSTYWPLVAGLVPTETPDEKMEIYEQVIRRFPTSSVANRYRLNMADFFSGSSRSVIDGSPGIDKSLDYLRRAAELLDIVEATGNEEFKAEAARTRQNFPKPAELMRMNEEIRNDTEEPNR